MKLNAFSRLAQMCVMDAGQTLDINLRERERGREMGEVGEEEKNGKQSFLVTRRY